MERGAGMAADNKNSENKNKNDKKILLMLAVTALVFTLALNYFIGKNSMADISEVKYSEFIEMLDEGKIEEVKFDGSIISFTPVSYTHLEEFGIIVLDRKDIKSRDFGERLYNAVTGQDIVAIKWRRV